MLAFVALGVAVVVLIVVNEWNIRTVRASRRTILAANIRRLELTLGIREPEPNPFEMTDEPGQMIMVGNEAPMGLEKALHVLRADDPPPAHASIPQWYEEYRKMMMMPRMIVPRDSQSDLEVW